MLFLYEVLALFSCAQLKRAVSSKTRDFVLEIGGAAQYYSSINLPIFFAIKRLLVPSGHNHPGSILMITVEVLDMARDKAFWGIWAACHLMRNAASVQHASAKKVKTLVF